MELEHAKKNKCYIVLCIWIEMIWVIISLRNGRHMFSNKSGQVPIAIAKSLFNICISRKHQLQHSTVAKLYSTHMVF